MCQKGPKYINRNFAKKKQKIVRLLAVVLYVPWMRAARLLLFSLRKSSFICLALRPRVMGSMACWITSTTGASSVASLEETSSTKRTRQVCSSQLLGSRRCARLMDCSISSSLPAITNKIEIRTNSRKNTHTKNKLIIV